MALTAIFGGFREISVATIPDYGVSRAAHLDHEASEWLPFGVIPGVFAYHGWFATSEAHAFKRRGHCMDVRRAIVLMLLTASCRLVVAQSDSALPEYAVASQNSAKLLVLVDGRIVTGQITPRPDGYDVHVDGGRMYIDSNRVRFEANSMPDAYERMRDSIPELTPSNHLNLARWCLENKLYTQAKREVLDALHLDPNREDAKRILRALEHVGKESKTTPMGSGLTEYPALSQIQRPAIETRSLAGLSQSVAHGFVRDVQPLLMNKCANSGCHGNDTKSEFQLVWTLRRSTPALAERNLAAVLKQIDFSQPTTSPLLRIGVEAHGNLPAGVFPGRSGAVQLQKLQEWVMLAANDIAPQAALVAETRPAMNGFATSGIQQVSAANIDSGKSNSLRAMHNRTENPHARILTTDDTDGRFLQEAKYSNRHDAFSPDEFNRRYHGSDSTPVSVQSALTTQQFDSPDNENIDAQIP